MTITPSPRQIMTTLLPTLKTAARYAQQIQTRIESQPDKEHDNIFGAALSDADLSVQTAIEVALLADFPTIRFYGEEFDLTDNTKYFRAITLGEVGDYLVTLDPIDGTRFYLDGHDNFCVILTVLDADEYAAAIALFPAKNQYYAAFRGEGAVQGTFADNLADCQPFQLNPQANRVYVGRNAPAVLAQFNAQYPDRYSLICLATDYDANQPTPNHTSILSGECCGSIIDTGKWIDAAAIAFLAQEAGGILTQWNGEPLAPLHTNDPSYDRGPLMIAANTSIHQDFLTVTRSLLT